MADSAVAIREEEFGDHDAAPSGNALRCLEILSADKSRLGGVLPPERADSLFEKRSLTASERSWAYAQLNVVDLEVPEQSGNELLDAEHDDIAPPTPVADPVDFLLKSTSHISLLRADEEKTLGRLVLNSIRLKQALEACEVVEDPFILAAVRRGEDAHSKLVLSNLRLVVSIAYDFRRRSSLNLADLVQDGTIGLMRAVDCFDPELGTRFSTYASYWIKQSIGRSVQNTSRTIRFPVHIIETINKLRRASRKVESETLNPPTLNRLVDELGWDLETTEKILALSVMTMVSTDDEGVDDDGPKSPILLIDQTPSAQEDLESKELGELLEEMIAELPDRQGEIIRRRFGFESEGGQEETLEQIGTDHGVTRERIRQIEAKAL